MATFIPNVTDVFPEPALFTPDFSFMDKMLQRRQSMYDQGWSQINASYNFVNRELTNPQNLKERDVFLKQAKNNLKSLSGMDLSQHQNVMSARGVFEPWANNTKALGDASLTSHWKQQEAIGEGYRLEDGGKFFNQYNVDYVKKQRAAFAGDAADSWEDYWKGKRSYTPYHDYHKHVEELMKDFKPSTTEIDRVSGLYKYTTKNADWTQAEIRKYLDANLSDQDKQQMKIEADVIYNNSPQQMGSIYTNMAKNEISQYDAGITWANSKLKSLTKPEDIKEVKEYIGSLEDKKKALNSNLEAIGKGDFTYVKKKGEELAMNIFYNQFMNKVSNGFSHADHSFKIDADEVALAIYKENAQDQRQLRGFAHDEKMARLKGEIAPPPQLTTVQTNDTKEVSLASIQQKVDVLDSQSAQLNDVNKGMVATWMQTLPENKGKTITVNDVTEADKLKFLQTGNGGAELPSNHMFRKNLSAMAQNDRLKNIEAGKLNYVKSQIEKGYTDDQKKELEAAKAEIVKLGSVKLDDGSIISATQILDVMQRDPKSVTYSQDSEGMSGWTLKIGNKTYQTYSDISGSSHNDQLAGLLRKVDDTKKGLKAFDTYDADVKNYFDKYGKDLVNTANVMSFAKGSYEAKTMEAEMYNIFPETQYGIQSAGIGTDDNNQGSGYFYITGKGDFNPSKDDVTSYLNQRGYKDVVAHEQTGGPTLYQIKNYRSPVTTQYSQFNAEERAVIQDLSTGIYAGDGGKYVTSPYNSYSQRQLQVMKDHNLYYLLVQGLDGGNTMDMFATPFSDPSQAIMKGQQLTATIGSVPEALFQEYRRLKTQ
jgi:hypothetical protein